MASNVKYETWPEYEKAMKSFFNVLKNCKHAAINNANCLSFLYLSSRHSILASLDVHMIDSFFATMLNKFEDDKREEWKALWNSVVYLINMTV